VAQVEAIAGKWIFEDLMPGMSDFDTRFICADAMTAEDWCRTSTAVGEVHLDLCRSHPEWARILEHLPGVNLTWGELSDEVTYYPEYKQWSFYNCSEPALLKQATETLAKRAWDAKDEYFHLKRFLTYFGPYDRKIDPAINLGVYEERYPLHSRLMHYFTPALQSAVAILQRRTVAGKMESLLLARELVPEASVVQEVIEVVGQDYEVPQLYQEPALSELEERLFDGLKMLGQRLASAVTILPGAADTALQEWKTSVRTIAVDPALTLFDNAKFARLMKGRLYFYANAPSHFATTWLIRNELGRIGNMFFRTPFRIFWELTRGETVADPAEIVAGLAPAILSDEEVACTLAFSRLATMCDAGQESQRAAEIVEVYDGFFHALHKISHVVRELQRGKGSK
jgi:hypothetical protein